MVHLKQYISKVKYNCPFMTTSPAQSNTSYSYVDAYAPPAAPADQSAAAPIVSPVTPVTEPQSAASTSQSESLEDQNIFYLLGVQDGTAEQREAFLDELQQVIWEDFLEYDVKLLITKAEQEELDVLLKDATSKELEKQEKIVVFLEKLIPDLEEIMLEKALELKEEMARERVKSLKEVYASQPDSLQKVQQAEGLMNEAKWSSAAKILNALS